MDFGAIEQPGSQAVQEFFRRFQSSLTCLLRPPDFTTNREALGGALPLRHSLECKGSKEQGRRPSRPQTATGACSERSSSSTSPGLQLSQRALQLLSNVQALRPVWCRSDLLGDNSGEGKFWPLL